LASTVADDSKNFRARSSSKFLPVFSAFSTDSGNYFDEYAHADENVDVAMQPTAAQLENDCVFQSSV
jgi:hypothetical protein